MLIQTGKVPGQRDSQGRGPGPAGPRASLLGLPRHGLVSCFELWDRPAWGASLSASSSGSTAVTGGGDAWRSPRLSLDCAASQGLGRRTSGRADRF